MITNFLLSLIAIGLVACASEPKPIRVLTEEEQAAREPKFETGPTQSPNPAFFSDVTAKIGLKLKSATQIYAVDFDNDGYTDLAILPEHYSVPEFFRFVPEAKTFVSVPSPFDEVLRASFLLFYDFDNDGIRDCLVGTLNQQTEMTRYPLRFFKGSVRKQRYILNEVKGAIPTGIEPTAAAIPLDFDLDGKLDLFLANWYRRENGRLTPRPDRLLKGDGTKFLDVSNLLVDEHKTSRDGPRYPNARPSFGASICDIDQNGYPDILVSNASGYPDKLWISRKDAKNPAPIYVDMGETSGFDQDRDGNFAPRGGGNSFYALCADYNNDGIMDIAKGELFHSYDPESRDRSSILSGSSFDYPPRFIRTEYHRDDGSGNWSQGDRRAVWEDLNLDGLVDLVVENSGFPPKSRFVFFEQQPNHSYEDKAAIYGLDLVNPSGTVTLDWNRDAKPDMIIGQNSLRTEAVVPRVYAFENTFPTSYKGMRIFLRGKKSNRFGIGAMVMLKTDGDTQRRYVHESFGNLPSQISEGVYFGLGLSSPKLLEVRWPTLVKTKSGRKVPLVSTYDISNIDFSTTPELTLCENGTLHQGFKKSCR